MAKRLWAFGLGLFLFRIEPTNLLLMAGYGLALSSTNIMCLTTIGDWIDKTQRLRAAQTFLLVQNTCVMIDCALLVVYFHYYTVILESEMSAWLPKVIAAAIMIFALIANLASQGSKISVEKDWIVVVSKGDDDRLAQLNSNFRTIDLSCQTFAPILAGLLFSYSTYVIAAIVIGGWNLVSVLLEYSLLNSIYQEYPELGSKEVNNPTRDEDGSWIGSKLTSSYRGWVSYMTHDIRNAGLGLALLYMTVLGFDNITWGYAMIQCVPEWVLGILVAVSGGVGILGTRTFPFLRQRVGVERAGLVGMTCLVLTLSLCVVSIWLPGSDFDPFWDSSTGEQHSTIGNSSSVSENGTQVSEPEVKCTDEEDYTSVGVMLAGIILARFGLWVADLSITQILQEEVEENQRGIIGGVQTSLESTLNLIKFLFVLLLPNPHTFGILILLSFSFVSSGAISLASYAYKRRKLCCQGEYKEARTKEQPPHMDEHLENGKITAIIENGIITADVENGTTAATIVEIGENDENVDLIPDSESKDPSV